MAIVETTQEVPLTVTPDGTIRIAGSRVSLDSVIYHYRHGATTEEIALRFPGCAWLIFTPALPTASIIRKRSTIISRIESVLPLLCANVSPPIPCSSWGSMRCANESGLDKPNARRPPDASV